MNEQYFVSVFHYKVIYAFTIEQQFTAFET